MSEWISDNIFIRPNEGGTPGVPTQRHSHNFGHTTFAMRGWWLVRGVTPDGRELINQFCAEEYRTVRALQLKYEPENVLRPVRFPDLQVEVDGKTYNQFVIQMIGQGDAVPDGAVEIPFAPIYAHRLIEAEVEHEFVALSTDGRFDCIYSHREPQGDISQVETGWYGAYQ